MDSDLALLLSRPGELPPAIAMISLAFAFAFGACWGSFLNVVIARVPEGVSVIHPRSRCPKCNAQIGARDNIPILSFLLLRARCRNCAAPISWRYPFIEAMIGVAATGLVARHGWSLEALELFVFVFLLVGIAFIDLDTWTVPHPMWLSLIGTGLLFALVRSLSAHEWGPLIDRFIGSVSSVLFLGCVNVFFTWLFRVRGRLGPDETAMGWGDPLILAGIGAYLGWQLVPLAMFLGATQGAIAGLLMKLRGTLSKGDRPVSESDEWIPPAGALQFGPFLALAAIEAAFFGDAVMVWVAPVLDLLRL